MPTYKLINAALSHKDASWGFHRIMSDYAAQEMDRMLVRIGHPLAYQPGTAWSRFQALHKVGHQFSSLD